VVHPGDSRRLATQLLVGLLALASTVVRIEADVILTAENLNSSLKKMERLQQQTAGTATERSDAVFALGLEGDALATLLSDEVIAHGMQEKPLIDLALARTKELGVAITYNREKRKFFYDGAGFRRYLEMAPAGRHAAQASFKMLEGDFYQSTAGDIDRVLAAAERKKAFLARYPKFQLNVEVTLMLAIDYRDLFLHYDAREDGKNRTRYRDLVRQQFRLVMRRFPGTEQADIARKLLQRFDEQLAPDR
jgi:hypothetical protein